MVFTAPLALYFFARGRGTLPAGSGLLISLLIVGLPLLFNRVAPQLDPTLRGFYELRNRLIPPVWRPIVVAALSLIVTFGLIHGNLGDVKILFGATASKVSSPSSGAAVLTVLFTMALAFLLLREPAAGEAEPNKQAA